MICSFFGNYCSNNLNFLKSLYLSSIMKLENWILFHRNNLDQSLNIILNNGSKSWELFLSSLLQPCKHCFSTNYFHKLATTQKRPVSSTNLTIPYIVPYLHEKKNNRQILIYIYSTANNFSFSPCNAFSLPCLHYSP